MQKNSKGELNTSGLGFSFSHPEQVWEWVSGKSCTLKRVFFTNCRKFYTKLPLIIHTHRTEIRKLTTHHLCRWCWPHRLRPPGCIRSHSCCSFFHRAPDTRSSCGRTCQTVGGGLEPLRLHGTLNHTCASFQCGCGELHMKRTKTHFLQERCTWPPSEVCSDR